MSFRKLLRESFSAAGIKTVTLSFGTFGTTVQSCVGLIVVSKLVVVVGA